LPDHRKISPEQTRKPQHDGSQAVNADADGWREYSVQNECHSIPPGNILNLALRSLSKALDFSRRST
jgi:hypothetical protein